MNYKRKLSVTVQFEEHQIEWLEKKKYEREKQTNKRCSISEINRETLQKIIDSEKK